MSPLLNLTENEQRDFGALPGGRYWAEIFEIEDRETRNDGKLPKGTPMIWIHFKVTGRIGEDDGPSDESPYYNRRVFRNLIIPPAKVGGKPYAHFKQMNGMLVRFFTSVGFTEEEVTKGDFEPDLDDLKEKPIVVVVRKRKQPGTTGDDDEDWTNDVTGFRNVADVGEAAQSGLL